VYESENNGIVSFYLLLPAKPQAWLGFRGLLFGRGDPIPQVGRSSARGISQRSWPSLRTRGCLSQRSSPVGQKKHDVSLCSREKISVHEFDSQ
jgi:hypothetical protein